MTVAEALSILGGVASRAELVLGTSRAAVDHAVANGEVVVLSRGRYTSPGTAGALQEAHRLSGAVVLLSAALHHGWPVLRAPTLSQVAVPRNRKLRNPCSHVDLYRLDLGPDDVRDGVTTEERTLIDCGRRLPDAELRIIVEADSFEWHGGRSDLVRDARRYNDFAVNGWLVLRFTWEDVMFHPGRVREVLLRAVALRSAQVAA